MAKRIDSSGAGLSTGLSDAYLRRFQMEGEADFAEILNEYMAPIPIGDRARLRSAPESIARLPVRLWRSKELKDRLRWR
jgi:hypothetical protein